MENEKGGQGVTEADAWGIAIAVVFVTLIVLVVVLGLFWDRLCAKIMLDALKYGVKQLPEPR